MAAMVRWAKQAENEGLPAPLIAALVHYLFVTIHPYYDAARLLATFLLTIWRLPLPLPLMLKIPARWRRRWARSPSVMRPPRFCAQRSLSIQAARPRG